jgi:hypothetical protein
VALGIDDLVEGVLGGTSWGVGIAAFAVVAMVGGPRAKPLAKQAIKGYLAATERVREMAAEATEQLQDLYAEAKYEYESQLQESDAPEGAEDAADRLDDAARPRARRAAGSKLVSASGEPA